MVDAERWRARIERAENIGGRAMQRRDEISMTARAVRGRLHAKHVDVERIVARRKRDGAIGRGAKRRKYVGRRARREWRTGQIGRGVRFGWRQHDRELVADEFAELRQRGANGDVLRIAERIWEWKLRDARVGIRKHHDDARNRRECKC